MSGETLAVSALGEGRWRVEVRGRARTAHEVAIPAGYLEKLGLGGASPERVLEESFRFLLEREPSSAILTSFSLPVIGRYFSEFETELPRRLA